MPVGRCYECNFCGFFFKKKIKLKKKRKEKAQQLQKIPVTCEFISKTRRVLIELLNL
jgi:hypothetical protein